MLASDEFLNIVKNTNLFAFDLIIKCQEGKVLLARRSNRPAKGYFFVPGGRVFKNEALDDAFVRILKNETNLDLKDVSKISFNGLYEHIYDDNVFSEKGFNTHYIVFAIELVLFESGSVVLDAQHCEYKFLHVDDLVKSDDVHRFVKNYFTLYPDNAFSMLKKAEKSC